MKEKEVNIMLYKYNHICQYVAMQCINREISSITFEKRQDFEFIRSPLQSKHNAAY